MVTGETVGLLVSSAVLFTILPQDQLLILGRIGYWKIGRDAGTFYCTLHTHPSWSGTNAGAMVVHGELDGIRVPYSVILTIIHHGRLLMVGRRVVIIIEKTVLLVHYPLL